mgnify:CR=1 FL=1
MGTKQTEAAHTPGPWKTEVLGHSLRVTKAEHEYDNDDIARIGDCHDATAQANANLIAAAPALYEAGERVIKAFEALGTPRIATNAQKDECEGALLALDAALRQARGEA